MCPSQWVALLRRPQLFPQHIKTRLQNIIAESFRIGQQNFDSQHPRGRGGSAAIVFAVSFIGIS
jgi:hypothetical protein